MPLVPLFRDRRGTTVAYGKWGHGGLILLCNAWSVSNDGIAKDDNLVLVLNALNHRDANRRLAVTFDEYHHGYGSGPGILSLLGTPARLGLAQLGMAFLLLVFAVSRRFGRPVPLVEGRRQRSEYLSSMSSLLRKARATEVVRSELGRRFVEDAATALGLPANANPDMILDAAARRRPDKVEALRRPLSAASAAPRGRTDEASLLALARRWHQMRKELMNPK